MLVEENSVPTLDNMLLFYFFLSLDESIDLVGAWLQVEKAHEQIREKHSWSINLLTIKERNREIASCFGVIIFAKITSRWMKMLSYCVNETSNL